MHRSVSASHRPGGAAALAAICGFVALAPVNASLCTGTNPPCVLTGQYGNLRQGYNGYESVLTPSKVSSGLTQKSSLLVDPPPLTFSGTNPIYAQPLYVAGITVASQWQANCSPTCNMLVVVTLAGSVWAFNADSGATIWADCDTRSGSRCQSSFQAAIALPTHDCAPSGTPAQQGWAAGPLPFAGIVSTPVIDVSGSPVMYLTSACQTSAVQNAQHWYLHKIALDTGVDVTGSPVEIMGSAPDWNGASGDSNGTVTFTPWEQLQRPALLQVSASGASPSPLIYITFGFGTWGEKTDPYHGWVFGYDSSLNQKFAFLTTANGSGSGNTDLPACVQGCSCSTSNCTNNCCTTGCVVGTYVESAQWCGQAGGIWGGAGRGPAANADSTGTSHAYFGIANGAFQQWDSNMNLLTSIKNWGNSVVDLTLSNSGFDSSPSEYFVPYGDLPVQPPLGTEPGGNPVPYAFEGENQNDFDNGQCGILLYDQTIGSVAHHRLLTCDKAGYAYLLEQGNLCGGTSGCYPGASGGDPGLKDKDPGNAFHGALNVTQCPDLPAGGDDACHRITSLAFCPDCSPNVVALWPYQETLTTLQVSDNTARSGSGTLSANTSQCPTGVCLSVGNQVIVGDQLVIGGQLPQTVTGINTDSTQLTVSPGITGTISATPTWSYSGYLVKPAHDTNPPGGNVQFPGGVVQISSNAGGNTVIWALASLGTSFPYAATLLAYDTSLNVLWCAQSRSSTTCAANPTFALSTFALPTIVNGYVYVPTTSIGSSQSGVLVFSGN